MASVIIDIDLDRFDTDEIVGELVSRKQVSQEDHERLSLFITSNIPFDYTGDAEKCHWAQIYGPNARLFSRLAEMCTPVAFKGTDKRLLL